MAEAEHILISLEPRHAENILEGRKRVELRKRSMKVRPGSTVWIYAKLPVGSIIGRATVTAVHELAPSSLWRRFGPVSGISHTEFQEYFEGVTSGVALELTDGERLHRALSLQWLRRFSEHFHPPQFFARLRSGSPLLAAISGG